MTPCWFGHAVCRTSRRRLRGSFGNSSARPPGRFSAAAKLGRAECALQRNLAELLPAGLLTNVRPPTPAEEAADLVQARDDAREDVSVVAIGSPRCCSGVS